MNIFISFKPHGKGLADCSTEPGHLLEDYLIVCCSFSVQDGAEVVRARAHCSCYLLFVYCLFVVIFCLLFVFLLFFYAVSSKSNYASVCCL